MNSHRFLIKYATRGRPEWFKRSIVNIQETMANLEVIVVTCDNDDASMQTDDIKSFIAARNPWLKVFYGNSKSKIEAINADMDKYPLWDVVVNMSDDMFFTVKGWDVIMRARFHYVWGNSTDFFAHFNDGFVGDKLATMSILGRDYYERDGYIYYPEYKSFSCDAEAMYVAMYRGRHHYFPEVLFLHQHPHNRPQPQDETYRVNSLATPHDVAVYWKRLNSNFGLGPDIGKTPWDEWKGKQPPGL